MVAVWINGFCIGIISQHSQLLLGPISTVFRQVNHLSYSAQLSLAIPL